MFSNNHDCIKFYAGKEGLEAAIKTVNKLSEPEIVELRKNSIKTVNTYFNKKQLQKKYLKLLTFDDFL